MADSKQFQVLFGYSAATFNQLLDCAARLSAADYHQHPGYGLGSIHDLLFHVLYWEHWWRNAVEHGRSSRGIQVKAYPHLETLRAGVQAEQAAWQQLIAGFSAADLAAERTVGENTFQLWRMLQHVVLHGMQHYSEVALLLTAKGQSPVGIDFIWFTEQS